MCENIANESTDLEDCYGQCVMICTRAMSSKKAVCTGLDLSHAVNTLGNFCRLGIVGVQQVISPCASSYLRRKQW